GNDAYDVRIFKSLTLIMVFVVGCYSVAALMAHITTSMMEPIPGFFAAMYGGIVINLGCACNYFILYACSTEYRRQFQKLLPCFAKRFNVVHFNGADSGNTLENARRASVF
ncbi:hypothetical protein AAVH_09966, partial [Aphelenchoides avenae]